MIDLVLENPRQEARRFKVNWRADGIEATCLDGNIAFDFYKYAGQTEATFDHPIGPTRGNHRGINHTDGSIADVGDNHLHEQAHLRRGQTDARMPTHDLQHVPREIGDMPINHPERLAGLSQHGIRIQTKSKPTPRQVRRRARQR